MSTQDKPSTVGSYLTAEARLSNEWRGNFGFSSPQMPSVQYFNIPIQVNNVVFHLSSVVDTLAVDVRHVVVRLDRHDDILREILDTVKVIEFETRRLNPDPINDLTDDAESGLNDILHTIRDKRFPPLCAEIDSLLSQAIERKKSLAPPDPSSGEELVNR